jgi:serine/threonine-protein kinase RsbW
MTTDALDRGAAIQRSATLLVPPENVDAVHDLLDQVWAAAPSVATIEQFRFATALIELCGNVMEYATASGIIDFKVDITVTACTLEALVVDSGISNSLDINRVRDMPEEFSESGRGIAMIQSLVDEFTYERDGDVNRWRIFRTVSV